MGHPGDRVDLGVVARLAVVTAVETGGRWLLQVLEDRPVRYVTLDALDAGVMLGGVDAPEGAPGAGGVLELGVASQAKLSGPVDGEELRVVRVV